MRVREKNGKPGEKWGQPPGEDIKWALSAPRRRVEMALFDLRIDPRERNNVANEDQYVALSDWFRNKLGRIILGDRRVECDWSKENDYIISDFAVGSDDKRLKIPPSIVPAIENTKKQAKTFSNTITLPRRNSE
jgi:hypothetical protein